tara:strand:- start:74 stop:397 length:324 start_codon:yes stop_codon:yes gene_type:complete
MTKNILFILGVLCLMVSCASWPWKYTKEHGRLNPGQSIFSQINDVMEATEQVPEDRCANVPDPGLCNGSFEKYFFNQETNKCESFNWGGCNGLIPFETLQECTDSCE